MRVGTLDSLLALSNDLLKSQKQELEKLMQDQEYLEALYCDSAAPFILMPGIFPSFRSVHTGKPTTKEGWVVLQAKQMHIPASPSPLILFKLSSVELESIFFGACKTKQHIGYLNLQGTGYGME